MKHSISTQELKTRIGEVVDTVRLRGDRYIVERKGKPVAALVPLSVNETYERNHSELFALMTGVARRNQAVPAKKIDAVITEAIAEVRKKKHSKRARG